MSPRNKNFVPRIGAAYRLTDKTVIRGGYGIFNEALGRYAYVQGTGPFQIGETHQYNLTIEHWVGYLESGHFFSPYFSGSDPSNTNTSGGLPNRVRNGNLPSRQRSLDRWFDAGCFTVSSAGTLGNSGPNVLEGPGYNSQNISLAKTFAIPNAFASRLRQRLPMPSTTPTSRLQTRIFRRLAVWKPPRAGRSRSAGGSNSEAHFLAAVAEGAGNSGFRPSAATC